MERTGAGAPRWGTAWRRLRVILTGLVFCRGVVLLCVLPPFEGWDEYQHVGYIVYLTENGDRPCFGEADMPASLLARLPAFPHCPSALRQFSGLGAVDYPTYWKLSREGKPPTAGAPVPGRIGLYQAQHGPLYYRLVRPLFEALGGVADLKRSIAGLRLVNLILTTAAVWLALGVVARLVRDRWLAALCGIAIATQPLFLINGVRVANDALGVFLATASIAWVLNPPRRHRLASSLGLGMAVGLAVQAKSVHFGLIPFIAACWLLTSWRERDVLARRLALGRALVGALALACGFLAMNLSEFRGNWTRFGSFTVMQESILNRQAGHGLDDLLRTAGSISWLGFVRNFWLRKNLMSGGWSWAGVNQRMLRRHELLVVAGLLGWAFLAVRSGRARVGKLFANPAFPLLCLVICGGYTVALSYHAVQSELCWGTMSTNPWYAAAAYPWFLVLVTAGAFAWPLGRFRIVLPALLAYHFLETESIAVLGSMICRYTALADWSEALRRLASLQPPQYGTTTLYAAISAVLMLASMAITETFRQALEPSLTHEIPPNPHVSIATAARTPVSPDCYDSTAVGSVAELVD